MPTRQVGESGTTDRLLGELIAEVRAVKHNQNNANSKLDAVTHLVEQVKELRIAQERHNTRIAVLEADKLRREGAVGLVEWVSRHWPFTVILAAFALFLTWANGKLHP
jgi:hypothetical protein